MLSSQDKQGSAIDLGLGPPLEPDQAENYKRIQQVRISGQFYYSVNVLIGC